MIFPNDTDCILLIISGKNWFPIIQKFPFQFFILFVQLPPILFQFFHRKIISLQLPRAIRQLQKVFSEHLFLIHNIFLEQVMGQTP